MINSPGSRKLLATAVAGALLPLAGSLQAAPDFGSLTGLSLTKELTAPVRHCNSAALVTAGKCSGTGPNRYQLTYAYWVVNKTGAAANVQVYDDIQKEFGTGATISIVNIGNASHGPGGLYDLDPGTQYDAAGDPVATPTDDDGKATTAKTADDDDAIDGSINAGFTGTTGGNIALLSGPLSLPKNKMVVLNVTFEIVLPTPLPTSVASQATLGDGTETPADSGSSNTVTIYLPAQVKPKTDNLGSSGCSTGSDPVGDELAQNGDFSTVVTLAATEAPRTLTAADQATLKFNSDLKYMGSGEDLFFNNNGADVGLIGINQHAMLGFPTDQMPPHTGPNNWLMYAHKATGATTKVWSQSYTGLTAGKEYQFSVLVSNALTPGFNESSAAAVKAKYEPQVTLKVQEGTGGASSMTNAESITIPLETAAQGDFWKRLVGTFTPTGTSATVSIEVTAGNDSATTTEFDMLGFTDVSLKSCTATTTGGGSGDTGGSGGSGSTGGGDDTGSSGSGSNDSGSNDSGSGSGSGSNDDTTNNTNNGGGGGGGALGGLLLGLLGLRALRRRLR